MSDLEPGTMLIAGDLPGYAPLGRPIYVDRDRPFDRREKLKPMRLRSGTFRMTGRKWERVL
jgi:hypothetical protein